MFKGIQGAVTKSVEDAAGGNFTAKDYVGNLSNQGTGSARSTTSTRRWTPA